MVKVSIYGKPHISHQGYVLQKITKDIHWTPMVNDDGSTSYIAEQNSTKETFGFQYGLHINVAKAIIGDIKVVKGTIIEGEKVKLFTGSDVLKLRLKTTIADEQRVLDQFVFATDYTRFHGKFDFLPSNFYTNRYIGSVHGFNGLGPVEGNAELNINSTIISIEYSIVLYNANKGSAHPLTNEFAISSYVDENPQLTGQKYDEALIFHRILKNKKTSKVDGARFNLSGYKNADLIQKRFKRFL